MKKITCSEMGGEPTCNAIITGETADEMVANGMTHLSEAHPELVEKMKENSDEDNQKWMMDFVAKFETLPEEPAEEVTA